MIHWGTLDPVAAFLLARGDAVDRKQAEKDGAAYYEAQEGDADPNALIDPRAIRAWVESRLPKRASTERTPVPILDVELARPAADYLADQLSVFPIEESNALIWIDPAGNVVARSVRPKEWGERMSVEYTFDLSVASQRISAEPYLPHR